MTKIEKTRIWPLRVIGNFCGGFAGNHLFKALMLEEALDADLGFRHKYHAKCWKYLNKPYSWWGTYYQLDIEQMKKDLEGSGWDDYDEFGKAYWENEGGPVDTTEERLKYMEDNGI
jgi:hypothetical protein